MHTQVFTLKQQDFKGSMVTETSLRWLDNFWCDFASTSLKYAVLFPKTTWEEVSLLLFYPLLTFSQGNKYQKNKIQHVDYQCLQVT